MLEQKLLMAGVAIVEDEQNVTAGPGEVVEEESNAPYSSWPAMKFEVPPRRAYYFSNQFRNEQEPNNFLKGVKW